MTIREVLSQLRLEDLELLRYAREAGLDNQFVEYQPGRFVGVNILADFMPQLAIEQNAGPFSEGVILPPEAVETFHRDP